MEHFKLMADDLRIIASDIDHDNIKPEQVAYLLNWMLSEISESIEKSKIAA